MNRLLLFVFVAFFFTVSLAGTRETTRIAGERQVIRIAHANWTSSVASANLARAVFQEKLGMDCELVPMGIDEIWEALARGEIDAMLSAWLPDTHAHFMEQFGGEVVDLGPNLTGTRTGLVVPDLQPGRLRTGAGIDESYITIDSIAEIRDHADKFDHRIIGIEREAGITRQTRKAKEAYGLDDFVLVEGTEREMIDALVNAILQEKWVVIAGWEPHWSFARWSLKFLDDPLNIYGDEGRIHTIVKIGLENDLPEAFRFLDNFHWSPGEMGQLMLWIEEDKGRFPYDKALRWMRTNPDRVLEWMPGEDF